MNTIWNFLIKTSALFLIILLFKKNCQVLAVDEEANTNLSNEASNISQKSVDQQDDDGINVAKRAWKQLQGGWGKRDNSETDYQLARNWLAQNSLNDDYNDRNLDYDSSYLTQPKQRLTSNNYDEDSGENVEKRAWKQMNAAWGKRVNDWNKFRGAWGKREQIAGWNNLKGLWGKRSKNWSKLNNSWGKRNVYDNLY